MSDASDPPVPETTVGTSRLEAFSDGVMAVIITITALSLKAPLSGSFSALSRRLPELLVYILSFTFVGIYWNNHHHLLRVTCHISGGVMWANLHLLFWLSLIPVVTEWVGSFYSDHWPAATYGIVALGAAIAFSILVFAIIRANGRDSLVGRADRIRSQGKCLDGALCVWHRAGIPQPLPGVCRVRPRRCHLVHPRSTPRAAGIHAFRRLMGAG